MPENGTELAKHPQTGEIVEYNMIETKTRDGVTLKGFHLIYKGPPNAPKRAI